MLVRLKEVLDMAERENKAIGMFNTTSLGCIQAVIGAAEELGEPVIIAHAEVHNVLNDIGLVGPAMVAAAREAKVPVCVHLDHGESMKMIDRAISLGFTSIMVDASALPYEENLAMTLSVVEKCHRMDIDVEAELGRLPSREGGAPVTAKDFYTDAGQARQFAAGTGIDALAVAFGTAHGFYKEKPVLDFDVVRACRQSTGLPIVMHGGSGVSPDDYLRAIEAGVRKINYYSYMSRAGYEAAKTLISRNETSFFHDAEHAAMLAMKDDVRRAIQVFSHKELIDDEEQ